MLLTTVLFSLSMLYSGGGDIETRPREFCFFMLVLEMGLLGTLLAVDLFLFYVFWELMLIPMYFLIGIWGHGRKYYAAFKFILYTMIGSILMLVAILYLVSAARAHLGHLTFDLPALYSVPLSHREATWLFAAFALAFAIKVPMWPVHTWLPDAHTEAPTAGSVILAGVMLKMGTYGFLRFAIPLFPEIAIEAAPLFLALAVVGIIYGALVAMVQPDLKRLVAYSSVSHLGFVMLGIFALDPQGMEGAIYQMLNHGISTGGLFLLIGMIYLRRHTREISEFGGLWKSVPILRRRLHGGDALVDRIARAQRLRRRVPDPARHLSKQIAGRRNRGRGPHPRCALHALCVRARDGSVRSPRPSTKRSLT